MRVCRLCVCVCVGCVRTCVCVGVWGYVCVMLVYCCVLYVPIVHTKVYPNGDLYDGEMKDGLRHGQGTTVNEIG